ncbi:MAG: hypothetical protein LC660_04155, partial [Desulfobacteraceae bacterium]|nr:hypothetical protein [Desulfobacteraceae bacterium]
LMINKDEGCIALIGRIFFKVYKQEGLNKVRKREEAVIRTVPSESNQDKSGREQKSNASDFSQ